MDLKDKIEILADSAKYDVSCSSSGSSRSSKNYNIGNASPAGICHSFTSDGRCISLLKILMTNECIFNCHYCINRRSNDIKRAAFTVDEICSLTMNFYRRNYIEGLFLSSGIVISPDFTMELIYQVVKKLREEYKFGGYIHTKAIPGADRKLIDLTGLYVDRMSVNIELPNEKAYKILAPSKNLNSITTPMKDIRNGILNNRENKSLLAVGKSYVPGGQSTQMIVGATNDSDKKIINLSQNLYNDYSLKRVYYSAYTPVNHLKTLPEIISPPLLREHRIYQADWLLRFYKFKASELLLDSDYFDENIDPKTQWALSKLDLFPVEINRASYDMLLRVPGIGVVSANRIVKARKYTSLSYEDLKKMGIVLKRARHFIVVKGKYYGNTSFNKERIYDFLSEGKEFKQISFFDEDKKTYLNDRKLLDLSSKIKEDDVLYSLKKEEIERKIISKSLTQSFGGI